MTLRNTERKTEASELDTNRAESVLHRYCEELISMNLGEAVWDDKKVSGCVSASVSRCVSEPVRRFDGRDCLSWRGQSSFSSHEPDRGLSQSAAQQTFPKRWITLEGAVMPTRCGLGQTAVRNAVEFMSPMRVKSQTEAAHAADSRCAAFMPLKRQNCLTRPKSKTHRMFRHLSGMPPSRRSGAMARREGGKAAFRFIKGVTHYK